MYTRGMATTTELKFENQEAVDRGLKAIRTCFNRYNNWIAKGEALDARAAAIEARKEAGEDVTVEEHRALSWDRSLYTQNPAPTPPHRLPPSRGPGGMSQYDVALYWIPRVLRDEHGIELEFGGDLPTLVRQAQAIMAQFGETVDASNCFGAGDAAAV